MLSLFERFHRIPHKAPSKCYNALEMIKLTSLSCRGRPGLHDGEEYLYDEQYQDYAGG